MDKPWLKHFDPWIPEHMEYPDATLYELVRTAALRFPQYPALSFMGRRISYTDTLAAIDQVARALSAIGFQAGEVATICLPNVPHAAIFFYAVNRLGGICNMVHPLSPADELAHYIRTARSDYLIILDAFLARQTTMLAGSRIRKTIVCSIMDYLSLGLKVGFYLTKGRKIKPMPQDARYIRWPDFCALGQPAMNSTAAGAGAYERRIDPRACAVYLHSGGTTGEPKTIMLSSYNFNILALQGPYIIGITDMTSFDPTGHSMVTILPLFHGFGLCMGLHTMLVNGMMSILVPQFTPDVLADVIIKEKPSYIAAVPTLFEGILQNKKLQRADLSCLRAVFCGGDTLTADLKDRFDRFVRERNGGCTLREGYGLTETVTVCAVNPSGEARADSVGLPLSDVLMKVVVPGTAETVAPGVDGEFCINAPTMMLGYLDDEEATRETIRRHPDGLDWVHTGDFGNMDADGYLHFKQRIKRILKVSGVPVFPSQVEDIISAVPGIRLACVIGVPHPYKMQTVKAFVVAENPHADQAALRQMIIDACSKRLIQYAVPRDIEFRDDLPRTKVGKIDFIALERQEIARQESGRPENNP